MASTGSAPPCTCAGERAHGPVERRRSAVGTGPIVGQLNRLRVQHLTMEFTAPQAGDVEVLRRLREDLEIGPRLCQRDPGAGGTPLEEIVGRVEQALRHVPAERITLNPDCGFAPGSAAEVSIDEVYTKLKNEVAAARLLRG